MNFQTQNTNVQNKGVNQNENGERVVPFLTGTALGALIGPRYPFYPFPYVTPFPVFPPFFRFPFRHRRRWW